MSEHIKQIESALDLYLENPDHPAYAELGNLLRKVAGIVVLRENLRLREALEYMTQRLRNRGFIGSVELGNINSVGLNALGVPKQEKEPRYDLALDRRTIVGLLDKLNDANIRLEAAEQRATKAEADVKRLVEALGIYADERNFVEGNDWFWVGDDDPKCRARETLAAIATTKAQPAAEGSDA